MRRPVFLILAFAIFLGAARAYAQNESPVRTFPEFVGTWILDESVSTGPLVITPRIPSRMAITTTPAAITIAKRLRIDPRDKISDTPSPEVYRFDGTETTAGRYHYSFRLVADALALTEKLMSSDGGFTLTTDAYSVTGDVLTVHRQLSSITRAGHPGHAGAGQQLPPHLHLPARDAEQPLIRPASGQGGFRFCAGDSEMLGDSQGYCSPAAC